MPVGGHILIVLFNRTREAVMTRSVGNKVIVVRLRRMHRRFQRAFSGIRNRPRRKPHIFVSVVARAETHVVVMQRPAVSPG
jgi:hypothetical protein